MNQIDETMATQPQSRDKKDREYAPTHQKPGKASFENIALILSWVAVVITFPICLFFCYLTVAEYYRAVFFRLGRVRKGARGPGLVWFLPCIDTYGLVDLRTRVEVLPTQEMITKDSVSISVDAVLFYCIDGSMHAEIRVANVHDSAVFIAQTTLRNVVGSKTLNELLTSREALSRAVEKAAAHATAKWGVKIDRVDIKDINLPESLQRALASEAEALREARAKLISAEGEAIASQALKEASDVMMENKITLQLRHLQILTSIAQERKVTLLYPFPMNFMSPFGPAEEADAKNPDPDPNKIPLVPTSSFFTSVLETSDEAGSNDGRAKSTLGETNKKILNDYGAGESSDATKTEPERMNEGQPGSSEERISAKESTKEMPKTEQPPEDQPPNPDEGQPQPLTRNEASRSTESQTDKRNEK